MSAEGMVEACKQAAKRLHEAEESIGNSLREQVVGGAEMPMQIEGDWLNQYAPMLKQVEQWLEESASNLEAAIKG